MDWSAIVISIIPFDEQGSIDESLYRRQLRRLRDAGVSVYVAGSSSSEAHTLSELELDRVLAISREELAGKVPFRAMGCEPRQASEMIQFLRQVERAGIEDAQIFSIDIGHGTKPSVQEMEAYYSSVIETTPLNIYLSCHPRSMGFALPIDLIERLCDRFEQIRGIAYGGLDLQYYAELIHRLTERLIIHNAGPALAPNTLSLGGNGFMGSEGNIAPKLVQSVIDAWRDDDREGFKLAYGKVLRLAAICSRAGGNHLRASKPIMNAFGLPGGRLRPPRLPIDALDVAQRVKDIVALDIPDVPEPLSPKP